ncbi:MAG: thioredoxin family protein [Syntrophobacteraceae bacterium]
MKSSNEVIVRRTIGIRTLLGTVAFTAVLCLAGVSYGAEEASAVPEVPVKGKVTMVDIGAKKCIPCKMMAPIMEELEKEYDATGKAAIVFIDVWENRDQGRRFGISSIPTQIFYDKDGKEVSRHEGFMDKKAIVAMLEKLGVK